MISVSITSNIEDSRNFIVTIQGELKRPKALNDALGRRLARELQGHFRDRNKTPNKLGGQKTNFWKQVADATVMTEATAAGAVVSIAETRYRIHLFGGTIKPTGGRKFLTIPLVKEAHGRRVAEYESATGRKLFRLGRTNLLMERTDNGTSSLTKAGEGTVKTRSGFKKVNLGARTQMRPVYALKTSVTIKQDPNALPDRQKLVAALSETATAWAARENLKSSSK